jgi:hypothetical protein
VRRLGSRWIRRRRRWEDDSLRGSRELREGYESRSMFT